ncbi:TonB-dependent receptor [Chitinophagaceae bacterium LWZ2-11]
MRFIMLCLPLLFYITTYSQKVNLPDSLFLEEARMNADNTPTIFIDDDNLSASSGSNISSLLTASRDPFLTPASFNFNIANFHIRGYQGDYSNMVLNGINVNTLDKGFIPWSAFGGLNDVMRSRDATLGLSSNTFSFGNIGTSSFIDMRASKQRKQTSVGYALSNKAYTHRFTFSHSSGYSPKGWAFTIAGNYRYANEGYVEGTFYKGGSYFIGIDKKIGKRQLLSFVTFGAPTQNARQGGSGDEIQQLAKTHYYNPNWGYQNGKKRSAAIATVYQPYIILTHDFRISNTTSILTAVSYSYGQKNNTALDWYNAPDPRPDYYTYLPSHYKDDETQYQQVLSKMETDLNARQINWQHLYDVNRNAFATIHDANGIKGNDVSGKRCNYIIEDRVTKTQNFNFNTTVNSLISEHFQLTAGLSYQQQINRYYKQVNDLLGGDFYVNINQFAQDQTTTNANAVQNDLGYPNRILKQGDKFGYDYTMHITKASEWVQLLFRFNHFDFFAGGNVSFTQYYRTGNVRNGLFPANSFGKSPTNTFITGDLKAGLTYKINGKNYLFINGGLLHKAPYFEDVYISPRTRDTRQDNPQSEIIKTIEAGYVLNTSKTKIRLRAYYTTFANGLDVLTFFHDEFKSYVNYALSNINKTHYGAEFGLETKLFKNVSMNMAAALGRYFYTDRQKATVTADNTAGILEETTVYIKNFHVPATPQEAYSTGFTYRSPKYWFISITGNYFDMMWMSLNPLRRTASAVSGVDKSSELYHEIIDQTKNPAQYTVDLFSGYSIRINRRHSKSKFLSFTASANNLLNNTQLISGNYEQLRFDAATKDVNKFPPKSYYAYGRTFFISTAFRF